MQQTTDCAVISSSGICHTNCIHTTVSQDWVLVPRQLLNQRVRAFFPAVHHKSKSNGQAPDDLLVLGLVRVREHLVDRVFRRSAQHHKTHSKPCALTSNSLVLEQDLLQLIIEFLVGRCHSGKAKSKAPSVLESFMMSHIPCTRSGSRVLPSEGITQISDNFFPVIGMDQTKRIQSTPFRERTRGNACRLGEILLHPIQRAFDTSLENHPQASCRAEFSPVGSLFQPIQIFRNKAVDRSTRMHHCIRENSGLMRYAVPHFQCRLDVAQNDFISLVSVEKKLEVDIDQSFSRKNSFELLELGSIRAIRRIRIT
mmetsp:Transcript_26485/g.69630  ORF Transcript_26485/g.69630 Transcript_26485/m.69630 type:complete len:312 (-) Transcript_26485:950-1885(-)